MPEISIITPFYNSKEFLEQCILSVLEQSFKDFELILINDGSTDDSIKIAQKFTYDKRIKIFSKENEGQGIARNFALKEAKGNIVLYLDSDDWLEKNALFEIHKKFSQSNPDILFFNAYKFFEETKIKNEYRYIDSYFLKYKENIFSAKTAPDILFNTGGLPFRAYRKDFLMKNNIKYSKTRFIEDSEFYIKALLYADKICCLNQILVNYRVHKNSTTFTQNTRIKTIEKTFYICEKVLKNSKYCNNKEITYSFLDNRLRQLFYYFAICDKETKKEYFNMLKTVAKYIKNTYGLDFIQKNTQFLKLNDIIEKSYEAYEFKKRLLLIKIFLKHYL